MNIVYQIYLKLKTIKYLHERTGQKYLMLSDVLYNVRQEYLVKKKKSSYNDKSKKKLETRYWRIYVLYTRDLYLLIFKTFFIIDPPKSINNIKMPANDVKMIVHPYEVHLIGKDFNSF